MQNRCTTQFKGKGKQKTPHNNISQMGNWLKQRVLKSGQEAHGEIASPSLRRQKERGQEKSPHVCWTSAAEDEG